MKNKIQISIIILNYNGRKWLKKCLDSILNSDFNKKNYEVIVVDNNSPDNSIEIAKKSNVKIIENKENLGFAEGNNIGMRKAKGDYIVLFNNDLIVEKNWLKKAFSIMEENKKIGALGGKIFYKKTSEEWFGGAKIHFGGLVNHHYLSNNIGESDYMVGAAVMFRKSVLDKIGLFDKRFFLYSEDIDLGKRIRKNKYKVIYNPELISYHMIEKDRVSSVQEYYEQRNRPYLCFKDYHYMKLFFILIDFFILFPMFWGIRVFKTPKKIKFWKETLKARMDSIKMMLGEL
jgi:GT2 family glycosyltransferase